MKNKQFALLMAALVALLLLVLTGCYTAGKADKQVSKALSYYPVPTIAKVRLLAPCITLGVKYITDSADFKIWQDSIGKVNDFYENLIAGIEPFHDTVTNKLPCDNYQLQKKIDYLRMQVRDLNGAVKNIKPVHDTVIKEIEDFAKVIEIDAKLSDVVKKKDELQQQKDKAETGRSRWRLWFIILAGFNVIWFFGKPALRLFRIPV